MAKKKQDLTPEERLAAALVPEEEWPYALPDGWKWVRLLGGAATCMDNKRKPVSSKERANRIGEIPYYGATGQVGWIDEYLTNEELILLGEDGAPFLDILKTKAYIINGKSWVNNHAHILKSFMGHIGNLYLMYYLNNFDYRKYVSGTTRLKLTQGKMQNIPVPYPPLSEQHRLVARIESLFAKLDAAKEKVQSVLDSHETRKAALLHAAFAGKLTAKWREENNKRACYAEEPLKNFVKTQYGYTEKSSFDIAGPHYLRITDIQGETVDWNNVPNCSIDETNYQKYSLHPNDIVVARTGATTGKSYMIGEDIDAVFASYLIRVQITNIRLLPKFLYMFFQSQEYWSQIMELSAGIAQPGVNARKIQSMMICVPSLPEQQEIVHILDRLLAREQRARQAAEETLTAIDRMKQSILARAFRGEL